MSLPDDRLPTFLIIGAQKSATRWLRSNLGEHPDICTADEELSFFNINSRFRKRGLRRYRAQFTSWSGEDIVGEATPGYMMLRHEPGTVARRIDETVPDVRLVAVLRDPVDRAHSALVHHIRRRRLPRSTSLVDAVRDAATEGDRLGLIEGGRYADSLGPYLDRFGDRLLVVLHEDVVEDPAGVFDRVVRHVGADPDHRPAGIWEVRFSNQADPAHARHQPSEADRAEVYDAFRDDVTRLEAMLGLDLARWDPTRG